MFKRKTIYITHFSICFLFLAGIPCAIHSNETILKDGITESEFIAFVTNHLSPFKSAKITYEGVHYIPPSSSKEGKSTNGTYVYRRCGEKQRKDIHWLGETPDNHYYVYDGSTGYFVHLDPGDPTIRSGPGFTKMWMTPDFLSFYGSNLDHFITKSFQILKIDPEQKKIRVFSDQYMRPDQYYEFTLLDDHHAYWKQCDVVYGDFVDRRVICDDFTEISGMLVPKTIHIQRIGKDGLYDQYQLKLIEGQVNNVEFEDGAFESPKDEHFSHRFINR